MLEIERESGSRVHVMHCMNDGVAFGSSCSCFQFVVCIGVARDYDCND